jgi:hypothetical protein
MRSWQDGKVKWPSAFRRNFGGIGATPSVVMLGLHPGIHHSSKEFFARGMDCRVI